MIPTLFGISFVTWLIMMAAPGRPGEAGGGMAIEGSAEEIGDAAKEQQSKLIYEAKQREDAKRRRRERTIAPRRT